MEDVKIGEILAPGSEDDNRRREERVRDRFWKTARRAARQVPFMEDVVAGYYCALDRDTPPRVRGILLAALAYFILPLDTIPDFLAGFGFTDDVAVLMAALNAVRTHVTPVHRQAAQRTLEAEEQR
ncbi:YkvA family protein [Nitratireductor luteus]|uniref:YkvA family protein n=1 Tax=Nitratireductor luteus TaxID=2976980 RepID=UPI0022400133|nr:YkvA family protein [Nitratireductor luteus]